MKKTIFCCDRCGEEITDIVYVLSCYAYPANPADTSRYIEELDEQNTRQNTAKAGGRDRHLCGRCKDELTDGVFLV